VLICLTWAGANFATQPQAEFVETEVALENAIAGSDGGVSGKACYNTITTLAGHQVRYCPSCSFIDDSKAAWYAPEKSC
jgi:hypothetical protein